MGSGKIFPHEGSGTATTPTNPEVLYHYTNADAFTKILTSREIWAHDSRLSNDRREIDYALGLMTLAIDEVSNEDGFDDFIRRVLSIYQDPQDPHKLRDISRYIFIASFSEEPNLLSQWRAYAPENGYSVGFNAEKLRTAADAGGFRFGKVEYGFREAVAFFAKELRRYLDFSIENLLGGESLEECIERFGILVGSIAPLVKHESFSEEREWRAFQSVDAAKNVRFYSGRRSLTPYQPIPLATSNNLLPLENVLVGPSDDHHALATWTSDYLCNAGYLIRRGQETEGVRIQVSGSPYRLKR